MALVKAESVEGFNRLPAFRQVGMMIGLAASVALGVSVVLWSQSPNYSLLYSGLSSRDAGMVVESLQKANIPHQLDSSGAVMVPASQVHAARMQLAAEGLPKGAGLGFEMLDKEQGMGTSQFLETARYQRALEGELSRTIASLRNIDSARVHIAQPKRTVFVRRQAATSASVTLNLAGHTLDDGQVAAIVHLVASSVPNLDPAQVTVVDQRGNLLTSGESSGSMAMSGSQFNHTRKVEESYVKRVEDLLSPLVGSNGVRAQVTAELDFTVTERTQETYNPDLPALRSEQISEDNMSAQASASGVPGALSNKPPQGGTTQNPEAEAGGAGLGGSRQSTRNYELDKTISHTRLASGTIRRLSVAVILDDKEALNADDELERQPWAEDELERFTSLVKEAVGFNAQRGDSVTVTNVAFKAAPVLEALPEPPVWEQPWVWDVARQAAGALGVLLLVFGVLRPVMRSLAEKGAQSMPAAQPGALAVAAAAAQGGGLAEDQVSISGGSPAPQLAAPSGNYDQNLNAARGLVQQDPKRVAQVVKNWVGDDG